MTLVTFGMAILLAAFGASTLLASRESRAQTLDEHQALAQAAARHGDYVVRQGLKSLDEVALAEGFDLEDADTGPEQQALKRTYAESIFGQGVYLADPEGNILLAEPPVVRPPGQPPSRLPSFIEAVTTVRPTVSGLASSLADGSPVVVMAAPVTDRNGSVRGVVLGEIALVGGQFTEVTGTAAPGRTGYTQIVDSRGSVLASTLLDEVAQENPHENLVSGLMDGRDGSTGSCHTCHQASDGSGGNREDEVMAFAPMEAAPWGVMVRQSESEALAPARRLEMRALWLGIPALVVAAVLGWALVRSVVGPVQALTASAQRLATGDLSQPVPVSGSDEIGQMAAAFERMRVRLKEALERLEGWAQELELRVSDRTSELEQSRDELKAAADENAALYEEVKRKEAARGEMLKRVISAQEEERRRIARELHDETSQNLAVLAIGIETQVSPGAGPDSQEKLDELKSLVVRTLDGVHRLVYDLRPSVLDDLGLLAGLRWYAESRLGPQDIKFSLMLSGEERRLPAELETALFRIGQEAISNVARHANASNAFLVIGFEDAAVTLEVEDDGEGFDAAAAASRNEQGGWGLMGMAERATLFGGECEITSGPGTGTRVAVRIPFEEKGLAP
jgi:signal transduction histidine kinase